MVRELLSVEGRIAVVQKSDDQITLDFQPTKRLAVLKNNNVSSVSSKDTKKIYDELKKIIGCTLKISFKDNNKQKFAKLDKVRIVTKRHNAQAVLRLTASSDDFSNTGKYAESLTGLDETPKTSEATLDFISLEQEDEEDDANNTCQLDRIVFNEILDDSTASDADKVVALTKFATTYFNLSCSPPFERN